jgi:transcriptional regulator with XRE-family HTH domain
MGVAVQLIEINRVLDRHFWHEDYDKARSAANLTQTQLAERLKTDQGNIARLERGRSQATVRTLQRIGEATGHSLVIDFRPKR